MRFTRIALTCLIAFVCASCGGSKQPAAREPAQPAPRFTQQTAAPESSAPAPKHTNAVAANPPAVDPENPAPPRDAQWTILCTVVKGPGHVERARQVKEELMKTSPMKTWYVTHNEQQSIVYYGYYRSFNEKEDAKEAARLKADRDRIAAMKDQVGNQPFKDARPVPVAGPDPIAPPEFNLVNAPGSWSLQIAAYLGAERKEYAVNAVRDARKMGVEAYYYHGPSSSLVCIGHWPEEAIRKQEFDGGSPVDPLDHDRPIMVFGAGAEIPDAMRKPIIDKETGRPMRILEQRVDVVDPTLRATMTKYPTHVLNGDEEIIKYRDPATGQMISRGKPTVIVPIPHSSSVLQSDPNYRPGLLNPQPVQPRGGQLKSIGQ